MRLVLAIILDNRNCCFICGRKLYLLLVGFLALQDMNMTMAYYAV
ncbi:hypothetical protein [Bacillus sp. AK031]